MNTGFKILGFRRVILFFLFYFILFYFILFYFILFYFILFYFILFYFILFYFILFYFILFYFIFSQRGKMSFFKRFFNRATWNLLYIKHFFEVRLCALKDWVSLRRSLLFIRADSILI